MKIFNNIKGYIAMFFPSAYNQVALFRAEVWNEYKQLRDESKLTSHFLSYVYNYYKYGTSVSEFNFFHFNILSCYGKNLFVTMRRNRYLDRIFNNVDSNKILCNKAIFNRYFADFINRPFLCFDKSLSDSQLENFFNLHRNCIAKPNDLYYGIGIKRVCSFQDLKDIRDGGESYIVEGLLTNHPELDSFNRSSLNTLRVITCIDFKGNVHIVSINLRTGLEGALVDNLKGGGICWSVDLETGMISSPGRDGQGNYYVKHPSSGKCGPGFMIPYFEELKQFSIKLAKHLPNSRYVGWDIAITPVGLEVIEGNICPSAELTQCNNVGLFKQIKSYYK